MKKIFVAAVMLLFAHAGFSQTNTDKAPLIIREQGSFLAGGTVIKGEAKIQSTISEGLKIAQTF